MVREYVECGDVFIYNYFFGVLVLSGVDLEVVLVYGESGIGFYIVDNVCEEIYVVIELVLYMEIIFFDIDRLEDLFGLEGSMLRVFVDYEFWDG